MTEKNVQPLLEVKDLKTYFFTEDGEVKAVDGNYPLVGEVELSDGKNNKIERNLNDLLSLKGATTGHPNG